MGQYVYNTAMSNGAYLSAHAIFEGKLLIFLITYAHNLLSNAHMLTYTKGLDIYFVCGQRRLWWVLAFEQVRNGMRYSTMQQWKEPGTMITTVDNN